jgi:uncharacterized protein YfaS (alpha-2-macroglobulin family)
MLLLSARLGDPIAADLARYIVDNPSSEQIAPLELLGYVRAALEWLPRGEARFAWTVSGERHEESLEPGASFVLPVTAEQRATLRLEPLAGELMIAASWAGEARYDELPRDALLGIARTVIPAADAPSDGLVRVSLKLTVSPNAPSGCIQVTDLLPSGLAPLVAPWSGDPSGNVLAPYEVVGQRVSWCIDAKTANSKTLAYTAHVVTAGTYRWEPAVAQMLEAPEVGTSTAPMTYTVR